MQRDEFELDTPIEAGEMPDHLGTEPHRTYGESEQSEGAMSKAQGQATAVAEKARDRADEGIDKAASGLEQAAGKMRERAEDMDGVQAQVGMKVADGIDKTAAYLKEHDSEEMWQEVQSYVKEHPMQAVAGAVVAGFVLARMMR